MGTTAVWTFATKEPMIAGAKPPTLRVLRRLPPAGAVTEVAMSGGRTQPGTGALEMACAFEDGCKAF